MYLSMHTNKNYTYNARFVGVRGISLLALVGSANLKQLVDDQYASYYSFKMKTMKWWKEMFFHLVARAAVNAYVRYNKMRPQQHLTSLKIF